MGHLLSSAIKMQTAVDAAGTLLVYNYDSSFGATCTFTSAVKNGSYYIGTGGDGNFVSGTLDTGNTFQGTNTGDCYGSYALDVYSNTRGYLYSDSTPDTFLGISSGTYTRQSGEDITISGFFFLAPPPPCFVAGTIIKLADGTEAPIETLAVGIELESVLIDTLEDTNDTHKLHMWSSNDLIETRTNSSISVFYPEEVNYTVIVNDGLLETTYNHIQLARVNGIWRMIKMIHLAVGDVLYDYNGNMIPVTSIEINREPRTVYKLTLSDKSHTYFANNILTHNIKGPGGFE